MPGRDEVSEAFNPCAGLEPGHHHLPRPGDQTGNPARMRVGDRSRPSATIESSSTQQACPSGAYAAPNQRSSPCGPPQTFHPDRFHDLDMRQVVRDFYQEFYSYTLQPVTRRDLRSAPFWALTARHPPSAMGAATTAGKPRGETASARLSAPSRAGRWGVTRCGGPERCRGVRFACYRRSCRNRPQTWGSRNRDLRFRRSRNSSIRAGTWVPRLYGATLADWRQPCTAAGG